MLLLFPASALPPGPAERQTNTATPCRCIDLGTPYAPVRFSTACPPPSRTPSTSSSKTCCCSCCHCQVELRGNGDAAKQQFRRFADIYFSQFIRTPFGMMRLVRGRLPDCLRARLCTSQLHAAGNTSCAGQAQCCAAPSSLGSALVDPTEYLGYPCVNPHLQDPQDAGPGYRNVIGIPGGINSPFMSVLRVGSLFMSGLLVGQSAGLVSCFRCCILRPVAEWPSRCAGWTNRGTHTHAEHWVLPHCTVPHRTALHCIAHPKPILTPA